MIFPMRAIVLKDYLVNHYVGLGDTRYTFPTDISGMAGKEWLYPIWVVASVICLALFIVYINKFLFAEELGKGHKIFALISLIVGFAYITAYGFFDVQVYNTADGTFFQATTVDKIKYVTASMIGLSHPWCFRFWGILASESVFVNTMYIFRKYNYSNAFAVILGSLGSAAIFMTINLPSMGEELYLNSPRCLGHWSGALLFAALCAAPLVIFLFVKAKSGDKKFILTMIIFCLILAAMLVLLITVGKSAIIENLPMWAAYVIIFVLNFTGVFESKKA